MRSNIQSLLLLAFLWIAAPVAHSQQAGGCEILVAALTLPDEATGLLHWASAEPVTVPLQLSTRYFSERVKVPGRVIHFYGEPLVQGQDKATLPKPLVSITVPADTQVAYIILWTEDNEEGESEWKSTLFRGQDWNAGSLKVLNSTSGAIGLEADGKRVQIRRGTSMDFHARDFADSFPRQDFPLGTRDQADLFIDVARGRRTSRAVHHQRLGRFGFSSILARTRRKSAECRTMN